MIVAKSLNKVHNLVEQKDIKETVIGSHNTTAYTHKITVSTDPTKFDYLLIYMLAPSSNRNLVGVAKYYGGKWYTMAPQADYRGIGISVESSGTSMTIRTEEWVNSSNNSGVSIIAIVGVNRGGSLAKILNWLAPRRKVVLAC